MDKQLKKHDLTDLEKDQQLSKEEQEDNEDELIRIAHEHFLKGVYKDYIDYPMIDENA